MDIESWNDSVERKSAVLLKLNIVTLHLDSSFFLSIKYCRRIGSVDFDNLITLIVITLDVFLPDTDGGCISHQTINDYIMAKPTEKDEQKWFIGHSADSQTGGEVEGILE